MQQKTKSRLKWSLCIFLLCWIVMAQSCMKFRMSDSAAKKSFDAKAIPISFRYTQPGDRGVHYVKTGADSLPTLFFVHGSPGSWDAFKIYLEDSALRAHFRMIAIDRPGFGYSDFGKALHLEEQAVQIGAVLQQEQNQQPFHLVGHSIGGPVIVKLAQLYPASVNSLTVLAGSISPKDEPKEYWRYLFLHTPLHLLLPGAFAPSNDEIVYFKKDLYRLDTGYAAVTMPVTFIHGDADKFVTVKNVEYGKQKLLHNPHVNSIIIPGASHFIPWEHFELIRKHLLSLAPGQK